MPVKLVFKDIFDSEAKIIAHQVNVEGVMGAGIAKVIKSKYPVVFQKYNHVCKKNNHKELMGKVQIISINDSKSVANLFAESLFEILDNNHRHTDYDALRECFKKLDDLNTTIALPYKIGCGLGGGDWNIVSKIIKKEFLISDVEICCIENINKKESEDAICMLR